MRVQWSLVLGMALAFSSAPNAWSLVDTGITGTVTDNEGIAMPKAKVDLHDSEGRVIKETFTDPSGYYQFFPITFGDYQVTTEVPGYQPFGVSVHATSGGSSVVDIHLVPPAAGKEMVLKVEAKRHVIAGSAPTSNTEVTREQIAELPQGTDISLPRLLETTTPGVVAGPFNQTFVRGNHANVQYQIDGVQLPDSVSGTFAEAFSTRNIDHMEFITGGLPAEYGERTAAVVNIVTRSGTETPNGFAELNYGSYNTFNPQAMYGGSNKDGTWHYFLSGSYNYTDRGLDTPQPSGTAYGAQQLQGSSDAVHDQSNGNNQFMKIDWLPNNSDKVLMILYQNYNFYQIPNYPSTMSFNDPYFSAGYLDIFGNSNGGTPVPPTFNWAPAITNDNQANQDAYGELVWRHTFNDHSFLQVAPYWKYSKIRFDNDPTNDLAAALNPSTFIPDSNPDSFSIDQHVNNLGLKVDQTLRLGERNLIKGGFQLQGSMANEGYTISSVQAGAAYAPLAPTTFSGGGLERAYSEDAYLQDDLSISSHWMLNLGARWTGIQYYFSDSQPQFNQFQPRVGVSYMPNDLTKVHAYYGRLFMPAPLEDLHQAFQDVASAGSNTYTAFSYNIKPEEDNYYEVGVQREIFGGHLLSLNGYYKTAVNMLDDTQLLNTAIATPYNYGQGYAYGLEFSVKGQLTRDLSDFLNYSYEIAKGENISGGSFAFNANTLPPANTYIFLDHVQVHTANYGLTFARDNYFGTVLGQYGSGLRTGPNNIESLPEHFTYDLTMGYQFTGESWMSRWKVQGDILNIFNNMYPITIANGFNGSHYSVGRELFVRLTKDL